jgi:uncharacterized protein YaeQ
MTGQWAASTTTPFASNVPWHTSAVALGATLYHVELALSDTDRGVYESLDLRIARHPSETMRYLVARTIGLALHWDEGIAFSRGLSTTDEPAVWIREIDGRIRLWMDVGSPSAERLHKAAKTAAHVVVFTYDDASNLRRAVEGSRIHRAREIEVVSVSTRLLDDVAEATGRHAAWELLHTGGHLFVTTAGRTYEAPVLREGLE